MFKLSYILLLAFYLSGCGFGSSQNKASIAAGEDGPVDSNFNNIPEVDSGSTSDLGDDGTTGLEIGGIAIKSNRQIDQTKSLEVFERTLYPYLRAQSCASCHVSGGVGPVKHSDTDSTVAHTDALTIVNIDDPAQSRIVLKLRNELHNCGAQCADISNEVEKQIIAWIAEAGIEESLANNYNFMTPNLSKSELSSQDVIDQRYMHEAEDGIIDSDGVAFVDDLSASGGKVYEAKGPFVTGGFGDQGFTVVFNGVQPGRYSLSIKYKNFSENNQLVAAVRGPVYSERLKVVVHGSVVEQVRHKLQNNVNSWTLAKLSHLGGASPHLFKENSGSIRYSFDPFDPGLIVDKVFLNFEKAASNEVLLKFPLKSLVERDCHLYMFLNDKEDSAFYHFYEPKIRCDEETDLYVQGLYLLVNGKSVLGGNTYTDLEQNLSLESVEGNTELERRSSMVIAKENGSSLDKFSIAFDQIKLGHEDLSLPSPGGQVGGVTEDVESTHESRFNSFKNLMYNKCMSCHGFESPEGNAAFTTDYGASDYIDFSYTRREGGGTEPFVNTPNSKLVVPGDLDNSRIWTRINGSGNIPGRSRMPRNTALTTSEKEIIKQFILGYGQ